SQRVAVAVLRTRSRILARTGRSARRTGIKMTRLQRLARVDAREIAWRGRASARIVWDRWQTSRRPPAWDRRELAAALADDRTLVAARTALDHGRWHDAHQALALHVAFSPQRFALASSNHERLAAKVCERFPSASVDATARADRILDGRYDLLGYRD